MENRIRILIFGKISFSESVVESDLVKKSTMISFRYVNSLEQLKTEIREFRPDLLIVEQSAAGNYDDFFFRVETVPVVIVKDLSLGSGLLRLINKCFVDNSNPKDHSNSIKTADQVKFSKLITILATTLINTGHEKLNVIMTNSLGLLGRFTGAERVVINLLNTDFSGFKCEYEWKDASVKEITFPEIFDIRNQGEWLIDQIRMFNVIAVPSVSEMPSDAERTKDVLIEQGVVSFLAVPLISDGSARGFIGFETYHKQMECPAEIIKLMRIVSAMFVNVLVRKKSEEMLEHSERIYRAIFENTGTATIIIDHNDIVQLANTQFSQFSGYKKKELEHKKNWQEFILPQDLDLWKKLKISYGKTTKQEHACELQFKNRSGQIKHVIVHADSIPNTDDSILSLNDITDRVEVLERLKELDKTKSEFVSMASHELRTPLTGMIGLTQTLLAKDIELTEEEREHFLQIIESEGKRLAVLLGELLDLTKIETGISEINPVPTDIVKLIYETTKVLSVPPEMELKINIPENETLCCMADHDRITQVLMNLFENAIRYSEEKGAIEVSVKELQDSIGVSIRDSGIGIQREELSKIFDKFYRAKTARKLKKKGTGLGLTIVKNIIAAHNGTISVESEPGKGSVFTFTLPKATFCNQV